MSDGKKLVAALLEAGSVETLRLVTDDLFNDDELTAFRYVREHFRRYGELPSIGTVERETRVRLPRYDENLDYYVRRVYHRKMYTEIREDFGQLRDALTGNDMDAVSQIIAAMSSHVRLGTPDNELLNLQEAGAEVLRAYDEAHMHPGISGIPTGWASLDTQSGGYQPGDLIAWVARMGMGKTYILLRQALHAWRLGYSVLVISMEMPVVQIARRVLALDTGINPDHIRKGTLGTHVARRLRREVEALMHVDRMHFYAGGFNKRVGDIETLVRELSPDIVFIDGAYILKSDGNAKAQRLERIAEVFDALKRMTITTNRPIVTTTQFSRQAGKKGKEGSLESISFSDAIAMNASLVYGIKEGVPPFQTTRRVIDTMKGREGESGETQINYRFDPMNFDEVHEDQIAAEAVDLDWMAT